MRQEKLLWFLATVGLICCAPFLYIRLAGGLNSTALGSWVPWGLWVIGYTYFIGLSAGAFLLSTLVYVFDVKKLNPVGKLSLLTAVVTLIAAMINIVLSLGHMERFPRLIFSADYGSVMGWLGIFYTAYFVLLVAELFLAFKIDAGKDAVKNKQLLKTLGIIGVPLAICFHGGVGSLFAVVGAHPYWNSALFPIIFLVGALLSGGALLTAISYIALPSEEARREIIPSLGKIILGLLLIDVIFEIAEFLVHLYAGIPAHTYGFKHVLFGPNWWLFSIVHVGLGVIVPVYIFLKKKNPASTAFACLLIALSFLAVRYNLVVPGQLKPKLEGLAAAAQEPRLYFCYAPNAVEWGVMLWTSALALFLFLAGFKILPIMKKEAK